MAHSRGFRPQTRGPKRLTSWQIGAQARDVTASGTSDKLWTTGAQATQPLTVIRTRGLVSILLLTAADTGLLDLDQLPRIRVHLHRRGARLHN